MGEGLELEQLRVVVDGRVLVEGLSLTVDRGETVAIVGPNGSGKTTVLDAVCGLVASSGAIRLGGEDIHGLRPAVRAARGLARSFQTGAPVGTLRVGELVDLALPDGAAPAWALLASAFGRPFEGRRPVGELSTGQRRMLDVALAVGGTPVAVLLDEPVAVLDGRARDAIAARLIELAGGGTCVVVVEHDRDFVSRLATRVVELAAPDEVTA